MPATAYQRRKGVIATAHNDQVERVAIAGALLVGCTAGQGLERGTKFCVIGEIYDFIFGEGLFNDRFLVDIVGAKSGYMGEKRDSLEGVITDQVNLDHLDALIEVGEDESRNRGARHDRVHEGLVAEPLFQFPVNTAVALPVECIGGFSRREIVRVHADGHEPVGQVFIVFHLDPDGLYTLVCQGETEGRF